MDPTAIGYLQGTYALSPLVARADSIADETRALTIDSLQWFHHQFRAWLDLIGDVRSGTLDAHRAAISSAAFRPNFHAARAAEYLEGEQWTESTMRYVQAAETLVRDVIMAALAEELGVELTSAERGTYWRRAAKKLSEQAGVDLDTNEAWQAFGVVYAGRNTRFAHGHEEATIEDALQARSAWTQMRDLMQSLFAGSHGVSLEAIQQGVLHKRAEQYSREELAAVENAVSAANAVIANGRRRLKEALADHEPKHPRPLAEAYRRLRRDEQELADAAAKDAMAEGFAQVQIAWKRVLDFDTVLLEVVFGP